MRKALYKNSWCKNSNLILMLKTVLLFQSCSSKSLKVQICKIANVEFFGTMEGSSIKGGLDWCTTSSILRFKKHRDGHN